MAAVTVAQRMTAEEFLAAPEPDHGRPWNLIEGEVIVNDPTVLHGRAQKRLLVALESGSAPPKGGEAWSCRRMWASTSATSSSSRA